MKTPKLLPCPHCGSEAQLELFDPPPKAIWNVSCKNDCSFDLAGGRAKVIAAWNRRAGQAYADAGLLEVLKKCVAELTELYGEVLPDTKRKGGYIECERCCGNGQTYGPNSGGDIICPDCKGTGRHD